MEASKARCVILLMSLALAFSACEDDESDQDTEKGTWIESTISPNGAFITLAFKIGDDGQLYSTGLIGNQQVYSKLVNGTWEMIAQVNEPGSEDFAIYMDTVYFSNDHALKKAKGSAVETVLNAKCAGLEVYNNMLIISGSQIEWNGSDYTIMSFNGETFSPIFQGSQCGRIVKVNGKLFIEGIPARVYDGVNLSEIGEYWGVFFNVDKRNESIVTAQAGNNGYIIITEYIDKTYNALGDPVKTTSIIDEIELNSKTIVFSAVDIKKNISDTYFLNSKNRWTQIPNDVLIFDLVNFDDRFLAATSDGKILELVLE